MTEPELQEALHGAVVSMSEAVLFEAGMSLAPDVRVRVALRLLGSVDPAETFDFVTESWLRTQAAGAFDDRKADPFRSVSGEDVQARLESKWAGGASGDR